MEKTIKKDRERHILEEVYINDNSLLEYVLDDENRIHIVVRYIDSQWHGIVEHHLAQLSSEEFANCICDIVQVNESKDAIAIFKKTGDHYQLSRLYDTENHQFAVDEFMDLSYQKKFPNQKLDKFLIKNK